jgi:NTP pyrophosphatase (non-canonical NTP hydrolase)
MNIDRFREVCEKAVNTYGRDIQMIIAMEECGELIQALSKYLRGKEHNVEEEIADMEIMIQQLKIMFDSKSIDEWVEKKINRLDNRIQSQK